jgi:UDP-N-acetylglucosamine 1-carboxyvinyltransferase
VASLTGATHQVIADRNEAVTFACAALATKGSVDIMRINPKIIATFLEKIRLMGAKVIIGGDEVQVSWVQPLKCIDIETEPEPGFMTDWQASFSLLLSQAVGASSLVERIFPYRFHHIQMLEKMGLKFKYYNPQVADPSSYYHFNPDSDKKEFFHGVTIYGPSKLEPAEITVDDLRAGATATIAALIAHGQSTIHGTEFIQRGYEKLAERLIALGADIKYIK